jgi:hypothetical protein
LSFGFGFERSKAWAGCDGPWAVIFVLVGGFAVKWGTPFYWYPIILWPHSRAGDCYVADLSVCISLMPLLSMTELGTKSIAELRSGPRTKLGSPCSGAGGCRMAEPWAISILRPTTELGDVSHQS